MSSSGRPIFLAWRSIAKSGTTPVTPPLARAEAAPSQPNRPPRDRAAGRRLLAARSARENATGPTRFAYHAAWRIGHDRAGEPNAADLLTLGIPTAQRLVRRRLDDWHLPAARPSLRRPIELAIRLWDGERYPRLKVARGNGDGQSQMPAKPGPWIDGCDGVVG